MFPKHLALPMWRHLSQYGRHVRLHINPRWLSCKHLTVSMTTEMHASMNLRHTHSQSFQSHHEKSTSGNAYVSLAKEQVMDAGLDEIDEMAPKIRTVYEVSLILWRLGQLQKEDKFDVDMLTTNQNLKQLCDKLHSKAVFMSPRILFNCLESLLDMSKTDTFLILSLEQQLQWLLKRLSINDIVKVAEVHRRHQETPLRQQIYSGAMTKLHQRWVEISNPNDLLTLMYHVGKEDHEFFSKLEERALDLAENMQPKHICRILTILSYRHQRNTPLIRALAYHLNKGKLTLSLSQLQNLLYACSSLSIYDTNLLEKVTADLKGHISKIESPKIICSLLTSSGLLRWRHQELLDSLFGFVANNPSKLTAKERAGVIMSIAKLNYVNSRTTDLVKTILESDLSSLKTEAPLIWLDLSWSLAILNMLPNYVAKSVLDPTFVKNLQGGSDYQVHVSNLKLANINTAVQLQMSGYDGPRLGDDSSVNEAQMMRKAEKKLSKSVVEALTALAPEDRFVKRNRVINSGYFIDAELFVDKAGEPKPFDESVDNPDRIRVCVRVLDFQDMTLSSIVPTGVNIMAARHLSSQGCKVVEIAYLDMLDKTSLVKRVQYLESRIKESVKDDGEKR